MRVIAGEFRSRRLKSLPGLDIRPTPDRLRESLFNILSPIIDGTVFVDAYAGTGSVGIEAISRGAKQAIFIEKNRAAVDLIRENLDSLGALSRARIIRGPASLHLASLDADIVFIDPPYPLEHEYESALDTLSARPPKLIVLQHASRFEAPESTDTFTRTRAVKHGDNSMSFYSVR